MTKEHEAWIALTAEDPIEPNMVICDAHHHLWDRPNDRYSLDDLMKDITGGHHITKTVYVECGAMYRTNGPEEMRPVGETEYVESIAEKVSHEQHGKICVAAGIVGYADLTLGDRVAPVLEAHIAASKKRFKGIRNISIWHENRESILSTSKSPKGLLLDAKFRGGFAYLKKYGLSFDATLIYPQFMELVDLARAFPNTPIIVDHTGGILGIGPYAGKHDEVFRHWKRAITTLATCPNVVMKLSGLGMPRTGFGWHEESKPPASTQLAKGMAPYFSWCIEQFGADRCMFGSNFPVDKISYSYTIMWNAFKLCTKSLSNQERGSLFHDTAAKAYRLSADVVSPK